MHWLISSTSAITGTGLKKCIPITRSGRPVTAASEPIGIELVARGGQGLLRAGHGRREQRER